MWLVILMSTSVFADRRIVEKRIHETRVASRNAKSAYSSAVLARSSSQQSLTALLQRQPTWSAADLTTFTQLLQHDHTLSSELATAKETVEQTDARLDTEFSELMAAILGRYHEEQIWSDKIRSVATYGSLAVLVVNVGVFIIAIVIVEPWKRRRLAETFEKKIAQMALDTNTVMENGIKTLSQQITLLSTASLEEETPLPSPPPQEAAPIDARVALLLEDKEMVSALAASAFVTGVLGWVLRSWWGS